MILDEIVRKENIKIDNESLDAEFNNAMTNLIMQGLDLNKMKGGKKRQQELTQAVAMDAANRVMTRKALDMIKSIAMGEYKPVEEEKAADAVVEQEKESE